jgi:hypothetical protein
MSREISKLILYFQNNCWSNYFVNRPNHNSFSERLLEWLGSMSPASAQEARFDLEKQERTRRYQFGGLASKSL